MANGTTLPWDPSNPSNQTGAHVNNLGNGNIGITSKEQILSFALKNMSECLSEYKKSAESFWTFGTLKMEQQFQVNDENKTAAQDSHLSSTFITKCPKNGEVTLVHCFQATRFIPIPNTKVSVQELTGNGLAKKSVGKATNYRLDKDGKTTLKLKPNVYYKIIFY